MSCEQPIRSESMEEMLERHRQELSAKAMELAEAAFRAGYKRAPLTPENATRLERIHGEVALRRGLKLSDLMKRDRRRDVSRARQECYALAADAGYTLTQIARYFGGYDHTSIVYGIKAHKARQGADT